jgi:hypothetical protein
VVVRLAAFGERPIYNEWFTRTMDKVYYVTMRGDHVEGPFDSRAKAKAVADDMNTHEVNTSYRVDGVRDD